MKLTHAEGVALVTGGSGGIGQAIVETLVRAGIPVGFTFRSQRKTAAELVDALSQEGKVQAYELADSTADTAAELLSKLESDLGSVRYLVHSSGIGQEGAFFGMAEEEWLHILDTNLTMAIAVARATVTPLLKAGFGRIVFLSSVSGLRGLKGHTVYAATKAGLDGFTRALARECASFGVTVNSIAPGYIDTPMLAKASAARRKEWLRSIPMGRLGTPEEVAGLVAFLCSPDAAYITRQVVSVNGGLC